LSRLINNTRNHPPVTGGEGYTRPVGPGIVEEPAAPPGPEPEAAAPPGPAPEAAGEVEPVHEVMDTGFRMVVVKGQRLQIDSDPDHEEQYMCCLRAQKDGWKKGKAKVLHSVDGELCGVVANLGGRVHDIEINCILIPWLGTNTLELTDDSTGAVELTGVWLEEIADSDDDDETSESA
jgi:hypothetical protein